MVVDEDAARTDLHHARGVERGLSVPLVERRRLDFLPLAQTIRNLVECRRDFGSPVAIRPFRP